MISVSLIISDEFSQFNSEGTKLPDVSTVKELKINSTGENLYTVLFRSNDFERFDMEAFYTMMCKVCEAIPNESKDKIEFTAYCCTSGSKVINKLEELEKIISQDTDIPFSYKRKAPLNRNIDPDKPDFLKDVKELDIYSSFNAEKKKKKKASYPTSKLIEKAKKSVKSHNIIISDSKKDIQRDMDVVANFLKKFIPGKESWIKKYRRDVLKRWISTFVITPKRAKKIKKAHKTALGLKQSKKELLKNKSDLFYDITR